MRGGGQWKPTAARGASAPEAAGEIAHEGEGGLAGRVYVADHNLPKAEQVLKQAIEVAPTMPEPYLILTDVYRTMQRLDTARAEFDAERIAAPRHLPSSRTTATPKPSGRSAACFGDAARCAPMGPYASPRPGT